MRTFISYAAEGPSTAALNNSKINKWGVIMMAILKEVIFTPQHLWGTVTTIFASSLNSMCPHTLNIRQLFLAVLSESFEVFVFVRV